MEREVEDVDSNMDEQVSKMRTIIFKQYVTLGGTEIMEREIIFPDRALFSFRTIGIGYPWKSKCTSCCSRRRRTSLTLKTKLKRSGKPIQSGMSSEWKYWSMD